MSGHKVGQIRYLGFGVVVHKARLQVTANKLHMGGFPSWTELRSSMLTHWTLLMQFFFFLFGKADHA